MAEITVIMPTYERTSYLRTALESALAQTVTDFVVSIGDNSTSDAVEEVVRGYDDPRIEYVRNRPSLHAFENWRQIGLRAQTPVLASLHDDDIWEPTFLERVALPLVEDSTLAVSFCDYWIIDGDGKIDHAMTAQERTRSHRDRIAGGRLPADRDELMRLTAVWQAVQPSYASALQRSALAGLEFPDKVRQCGDLWLSTQLALRTSGFHYTPERLTRFRVHGGSLSSAGALSTLADAEDAAFSALVGEVGPATPVGAELRRRWADLRVSRASVLMRAEGRRADSQRELRAAASDLTGRRALATGVLGRSRVAWDLARIVRGRTG